VVPRAVIWVGTAYLQVRNEPRKIMLVDLCRMMGIVVGMHLTALAMKAMLHAKVPFLLKLAKLVSVTPGDLSVLVVCSSVGVVFTLSALSYMVVIRQIDRAPLRAQILPLLWPTIACIPMVLAIWATRQTLFKLGFFSVVDFSPQDVVPLGTRAAMFGPRLLIEIVVGAVVYVPSALLISPRASREFLHVIKDGIRRRRGGGRPSLTSTPDAAGVS
jgi:lipopolysaccharide exporter